MASIQQISILAGSAVVALAVAFPVQAEEVTAPVSTMADSTEQVFSEVETTASETAIETTGLEMTTVLSELSEEATENSLLLEEAPETEQAVQTLDAYLANSLIETDAATTADSFFAGTDGLETAQTTEGGDVAQVTRPLYRGVAPFYVGVGGNIGIIGSGKSAVGDFGFNIISKISLGPRFAVRPMFQFSEDDFNITLPVTFNFDPLAIGGFSLYPSLGAGVDFGDDIGLLINGGVDVPISRDFTFNSQLNWRVTEDTGLGLSLGVGYNFPIFFE